ncbi:putative phage protein (TIGR02218 family) [Methylosinus sp. sav-2]|uniref:DUF2163 domain-containing protein n=1 Tax=Methylosinus sp. sav-2 TaxID=2485168 RepID=UPI00047A1198|nr:DUF2163 domain-containing protein [Methylosinus sp. sav-2]TDX65146.1 putative phage protein (TIGR02218 family) [Methylosinus sp. sav-2]
MKNLSPAFVLHLASGATTLAYCWRIRRRDGVILGFTEHDENIVYAGTIFEASSGFTASQIQQGLGLSIDNFTASGALSSLAINETDLLAGRYDDATVELFWVNWADPTQGVTISKGNLGEVKRQGLAFTAEFRSLSSRLNQPVGGIYQRTCSAVLGDAKCRVDLSNPAMHGTALAQTTGIVRDIVVTGLSAFASDWFTDGVMSFTSGANSGLSFEIKNHLRTSGVDIIELWSSPEFALAIGDAANVTVGCRKTFNICKSKFQNGANFRGFPHIPGNDRVTSIATRDTPGMDGGSILGN